MTVKTLWIGMFAGALCVSAAPAQEPPAGDGPAVTGLDGSLAPQFDENFIREARQRRLGMERSQVAAEIRGGLLFDPSKIAPAVASLGDGAKDTTADNAERICRAFAQVDPRFGAAWALLQDGRHEEAAQAFKPLISMRDTSYFAAAKQFCYAEALAGSGPTRYQDAADAYSELVKTLAERFCFASEALLKAGRTYERMDRLYYAMTLYELWIESFGILDPQTSKELGERCDQIAADYADPMGTLAKKMSDVAGRLDGVDSGTQTQKRQREIVAMLSDLIANAEESQQSQSSSQQQQQQQPGECQPGECKSQGGKQGPASGIGIPSAPATVSRLVGGAVLRPQGLSKILPSNAGDDWGRLPPEEQRKLLETFKESMPERYRMMIRDYYRRMASEENR